MGCTSSKTSVQVTEPLATPGQQPSLLGGATAAPVGATAAKAEGPFKGSSSSSSGGCVGGAQASEASTASSTAPAYKANGSPIAKHNIQVTMTGVRGLRPAGGVAGRSDIQVEVSIEGRPDVDKISTPVLSGIAAKFVANAPPSISMAFMVDGELKGWSSGEKIDLVVRGYIKGKAEIIGRAVLSEKEIMEQFQGELPLRQTADSKAILKLKVCREEIVPERVPEVVDALITATDDVGEVASEQIATEAARVEEEADVTIKDSAEGLLDGTHVSAQDIVDAVGDTSRAIRTSTLEPYAEVEEAKGAVCCWC